MRPRGGSTATGLQRWPRTSPACVARGRRWSLVSSGAIALGRGPLQLAAGRLRLEESQAAAAVGQIRLAHAWKEVLEQHGLTVAQVLLTLGDTEQRRRYLNARGTLFTLLRLGAVPVINENDTVATAEIRYGDNDRLAARVAQMVSADCLVLLSDVDGLYTADPTRDRGARLHPGGDADHAGDRGDGRRRRPRRWAPAAWRPSSPPAKIALAAGCHMCVATGREHAPAAPHRGGRALHVVRRRGITAHGAQAVDRGQRCSRSASCTSMRARCARCATGKSLLPAGVTRVERPLRSRRHRGRARAGRRRDRARPDAPTRAATRSAILRPAQLASSRRCLDFAGATR